MADLADKTNFDKLCTKCEQMELDVSKIVLTRETNVCDSFSVMHMLCYFALEQKLPGIVNSNQIEISIQIERNPRENKEVILPN